MQLQPQTAEHESQPTQSDTVINNVLSTYVCVKSPQKYKKNRLKRRTFKGYRSVSIFLFETLPIGWIYFCLLFMYIFNL